MNEILARISQIGVVPVIAIDDAAQAVPLARALVKGGLRAAEVTFRTDAAAEAMEAIAAEVPDMLLGAGTVLTREQVDRALEAGARFLVSPGFNPDVVEHALSRGALIVPGTATPGEMEQAMALGLEAVKFFPAEQNGGVAKLKAIAGPYKDLRWMPTGGIDAKNLMSYLAFDQILACGGTWMVKKDLIAAGDWEEIARRSAEAVKIMLGFTLHHVGINCGCEAESERVAKRFCAVFGFDYRPGGSSNCALPGVECTKSPYLGAHGHIAVGTHSVERAMYHLGARGVRFDETTRRTDAKGRVKAVYLAEEFGGFAVHLVQN